MCTLCRAGAECVAHGGVRVTINWLQNRGKASFRASVLLPTNLVQPSQRHSLHPGGYHCWPACALYHVTLAWRSCAVPSPCTRASLCPHLSAQVATIASLLPGWAPATQHRR